MFEPRLVLLLLTTKNDVQGWLAREELASGMGSTVAGVRNPSRRNFLDSSVPRSITRVFRPENTLPGNYPIAFPMADFRVSGAVVMDVQIATRNRQQL